MVSKYFIRILFLAFSANVQLFAQTSLSEIDSIDYYLKSATESIHRNKAVSTYVNDIDKALVLSLEIDNDSVEHIVTIKIGQFYNKINDTVQSEYYLNKGIRFFEKQKNYAALAPAYKSLGLLAFKKGVIEKAVEYTKVAFEYGLKSKDSSLLLSPLNNLMFYASKAYNQEQERYYAKLGVEIANKLKDTTVTAYRLRSNYAASFLEENNHENAWELYKPVISFYKRNKMHADISIIHNLFIEYFKKHENDEKLLFHLSELRQNYLIYNKKMLELRKADIKETLDFKSLGRKFELSKNQLKLAKISNDRLIYIVTAFSLLLVLSSLFIFLIKRKNTLLKKLKTNAEKASIEKSKFIAMISHELRTPLHAVLGFSAFLMDDDPKKSQKTHLELLNSSANHLLNLINNVLKLYESDYKKITPTVNAFEFRKAIKMITDSFAILFEQKNNLFELYIDENITDSFFGDSQKITQILTNLISNANKFTENGHVSLFIKQLKVEKNISTLYFCVEDDGLGVAKEDHNSIFEAFNPNTMNIEKKHDGTGLGLSITKQLTEAMGSTIKIESAPGRGSKFSFILELKEIEPLRLAAVEANAVKITESKILVVEDNKINQLLIRKTLDKEHLVYDLCENGLEAVNQFKSKPKKYYDLVLMDIHMPVMNGYEASKIIHDEDQNVPIIAMTATNLRNEEQELKDKHLSAVIYKPFKTPDLFNEMNRQLFKSQRLKSS